MGRIVAFGNRRTGYLIGICSPEVVTVGSYNMARKSCNHTDAFQHGSNMMYRNFVESCLMLWSVASKTQIRYYWCSDTMYITYLMFKGWLAELKAQVNVYSTMSLLLGGFPMETANHRSVSAVESMKTKLWEAVVVGVQVASHQCGPGSIPSWGSDPGVVSEKGFVPVGATLCPWVGTLSR